VLTGGQREDEENYEKRNFILYDIGVNKSRGVVPNVAVEWLALLHNREVPGSNLGPESDYPDGGFQGFPQSLQTKQV
jgi:hypothetical protein